MLIAILAALICTVVLGAILLIPKARNASFLSRSIVASTHGILGALGLAGSVWWLEQTGQTSASIAQTAIGLTGAGLVLGIVIFFMARHRQKPPDLTLTSHVIFAGMGAVVIMGLILGAIRG